MTYGCSYNSYILIKKLGNNLQFLPTYIAAESKITSVKIKTLEKSRHRFVKFRFGVWRSENSTLSYVTD